MGEQHEFNPQVAAAALDAANPTLNPGGYCATCGQAQIKINNVFTCPNCSSASAPTPTMVDVVDKSGNLIKRVTEEEALKIEGRHEKISKVEKRVAQLEGRNPGKIVPGRAGMMEEEAAAIGVATQVSQAKSYIGGPTPKMTVGFAFDYLDAELSQAKFSSLGEAKKILKLRQKLALLKLELGDFLKG